MPHLIISSHVSLFSPLSHLFLSSFPDIVLTFIVPDGGGGSAPILIHCSHCTVTFHYPHIYLFTAPLLIGHLNLPIPIEENFIYPVWTTTSLQCPIVTYCCVPGLYSMTPDVYCANCPRYIHYPHPVIPWVFRTGLLPRLPRTLFVAHALPIAPPPTPFLFVTPTLLFNLVDQFPECYYHHIEPSGEPLVEGGRPIYYPILPLWTFLPPPHCQVVVPRRNRDPMQGLTDYPGRALCGWVDRTTFPLLPMQLAAQQWEVNPSSSSHDPLLFPVD